MEDCAGEESSETALCGQRMQGGVKERLLSKKEKSEIVSRNSQQLPWLRLPLQQRVDSLENRPVVVFLVTLVTDPSRNIFDYSHQSSTPSLNLRDLFLYKMTTTKITRLGPLLHLLMPSL